MVEVLFWLNLGLVGYVLLGYPLLLSALALVMRRGIRRDDVVRRVDIIIPVHNGASEVEDKIRNCLEMDYPAEARRVLVVSDGSTDDTAARARKYASAGVESIEIPDQVGKVAAQNVAVQRSTAEIVLFTDLAIRVDRQALRHIVSDFADPAVAAVSCVDRIVRRARGSLGESLYIRYDMAVRRYAVQTGSLIGVTGGFYAVRRQMAEEPWDPAFPPDFYVALRVLERGYRVVQDERVVAAYAAAADPSREFERKVRTTTRAIWALLAHVRLLNPLRYGLVSLTLLTNKLLRWATPFLLAGLFVLSWLAFLGSAASGFWGCVFAVQVLFYGLAGLSFTRLARWPWVGSVALGATYVVVSNAALLWSWRNVLAGMNYTVWEPTPRGGRAASEPDRILPVRDSLP